MVWKKHRVIFRLVSPLHIGQGRVGNLQRARPYVTGRVFWGALTRRITRDLILRGELKDNPLSYKQIGMDVNEYLAFTYFYPTLMEKESKEYKIIWPWEDENRFNGRFMSSFTSTALSNERTADEGLLWETEFLSPNTLDNGEQIYLSGYIFVKEDCMLDWLGALKNLRFGGESAYGCGVVRVEEHEESKESGDNNEKAFTLAFKTSYPRPRVCLAIGNKVLAHTIANDAKITGKVEPLVGREWSNHAGQRVALSGLCFIPGSTVVSECQIEIGYMGVWEIFTQP